MENLTQNQLKQIEKIKNQFTGERKSDKNSYEYLVSLNKACKKPAVLVSTITGTLSSLIFGTGMSMCMSGVMILGVIIGLLGGVGMGFAYPIYKTLHRKELKKHKKEILSLTEKLEKSE